MPKYINLKPVETTPEIMQSLEDKGLIIRLCPDHHVNPVAPGETKGRPVYISQKQYGPHKLQAVTVDRTAFTKFGTHPDNEEFLLIGGPGSKPMYLVISYLMKNDLEKKITQGNVKPEDFICLKTKFNDPEVSFFTMLANVPHGEAVMKSAEGNPVSFYVTESAEMGIDVMDLGDYEFKVLDF